MLAATNTLSALLSALAHRSLRQVAILCLTWLLIVTNVQAAPPLRIAVAANFYPILQQLTLEFNKQNTLLKRVTNKAKIQLISGATGSLYQQIRHGAPFDLFLAADSIRPKKLEQLNLIINNSRQTYAFGQLALYSATKTNYSLAKLQQATNAATDPQRFAIANPDTAPYGKAAKQSLRALGLWQQLKTQLIVGININQTFQQVRSQAVSAGIVAYSQLKLNKLAGQLLPETSYSPIEQQLIILKSSKNIELAQQFSDFLRSVKTQKMIQQFGYQGIKVNSTEARKNAGF
jgi:molybdate transport system substrate-binding protein